LAGELVRRYGYAVTYEESPFDPAKLLSETLANGRLYLSVPVVSTTFQMPEVTVGEPVPGALDRVPAGLPDVVLPLLAAYNQAGSGTAFTALFEGGYAHIVPTNRIVNGKAEPFQPILGTVVAMNVRGGSCSDALNSLLAQVNAARGVRVVRGMLPIGSLLMHECYLNVSSLPARDVLASILDQLGRGSLGPKPRFSWSLFHDPTLNEYFLSTDLIPDLNAKPEPPAAPAAAAPGDPSKTAFPVK
jgi:hypothetical protein